VQPQFEVQLKIHKPLGEVFDAVVNPKKLTGYFVQTSSGPLVEGKTVMWSFAEHPSPFPVKVKEVIRNERIVFEWEAAEGGYDTKVEMSFKALDARSSMVQIRESGWRDTPKGIETSYGNAAGWMHMMCSMNAYLVHGINLREGGVK
jgi:uncharacterized protein YndB with AHSA1/START domain